MLETCLLRDTFARISVLHSLLRPPGVLKLQPTGWIRPPRVLNPAPVFTEPPCPPPPPPHPPPPGVGGGNQAAADDCLPLHPRAGPLVKKFEVFAHRKCKQQPADNWKEIIVPHYLWHANPWSKGKLQKHRLCKTWFPSKKKKPVPLNVVVSELNASILGQVASQVGPHTLPFIFEDC